MLNELDPAAEHTFPAEQAQQSAQSASNQKDPALIAQNAAQKEANISTLRQRAESAERRMQELERLVQMNMSQNQQTTKMQLVDDEDDIDVSDDTYIEGKHLKKYFKAIRKELKETKKQLEDNNRENAIASAEIRLKSQYPDFDSVVSTESLKKLQEQKPALFRTIYANTDIGDRGIAAYEFIKSSGIAADEYQSLDKKVEENRTKPRSAANVSPQTSDTPLARVGDYDRRILSEERKDQLRRQVEYAKSLK